MKKRIVLIVSFVLIMMLSVGVYAQDGIDRFIDDYRDIFIDSFGDSCTLEKNEDLGNSVVLSICTNDMSVFELYSVSIGETTYLEKYNKLKSDVCEASTTFQEYLADYDPSAHFIRSHQIKRMYFSLMQMESCWRII